MKIYATRHAHKIRDAQVQYILISITQFSDSMGRQWATTGIVRVSRVGLLRPSIHILLSLHIQGIYFGHRHLHRRHETTKASKSKST